MKKRAPVVDQAALMAAQSQSFIEGQRVWVPNTSSSPSPSSSTWSCGTIVGVSRSADEVVTLTVKLEGETQDATTVSVPAMQCFLQNETDPDDLTKSDYLHEPGILHTLRARFDLDSIYTYSGQILIALNPFKPLKHLYGPRMMTAFKGGGLEDLSPHCYAVAEAAYAQMMIEGHRQAVLISGESGAGKTVTARLCMAYLAERSGQGAAMAMPIEQQVLESNPLLEAFGNAKTVRNDNSSRFGKYIEMDFSLEGRLNGAHVSTYLLERSRVVSVSADERSFHIFYQLLAGCPEGLRERLFLPGVNMGASSTSSTSSASSASSASSFAYLAQSSVTTLAGTDDRAAFEETVSAMKVIGLDEGQIEAVLEVVAAVLHLGNIRFEGAMDAKADEAVVCSDETSLRSLQHVATLLGTSPEELRRALMSRKITIGGEVIVKEFNVLESIESRDSLSKALYGRLFDWIVAAVNEKIGRVGGGGRSPRWVLISILISISILTDDRRRSQALARSSHAPTLSLAPRASLVRQDDRHPRYLWVRVVRDQLVRAAVHQPRQRKAPAELQRARVQRGAEGVRGGGHRLELGGLCRQPRRARSARGRDGDGCRGRSGRGNEWRAAAKGRRVPFIGRGLQTATSHEQGPGPDDPRETAESSAVLGAKEGGY